MYMLVMYYMYMLIIIFIIGMIYLLNNFFSMMKSDSKEKKCSYECGFNPITKSFIPFSIPFYLMSLMFLVFDIEIVLIVPFVIIMKYLSFSNVFFVFLFFFFIMIFSLLYEWFMNYLGWLY